MIQMLNNAFKSGTDYGQFKIENADLAKATKTEVVYGRDIGFLSLCEIPEYQEDNATTFFLITDASLRDFRKFYKPMGRALLNDTSCPAELVKELKETTGLMFYIDGEKYLVGQHAMATLCMQASVSGTMTLQRSNFLRDMHIADAVFYKNSPLTLVYREMEIGGISVKKVFAVFAGAYKEIPQTVVTDIAESVKEDDVMGTAEVSGWYIDHSISRIEMTYPKISEEYTEKYGIVDITPGVMVQTSDIGDSAVRIFGIQQIRKNSYVITEEIAAKHTKNADATEIIKDVDEKIFFNHRKLPELLADLIGQEAVDYTKANAHEALMDLIDDSAFKLLKGVLPKRQTQGLTDALKMEFAPGVIYTLYDVALSLMELPSRIKGIDDNLMLSVRKALADAPKVVKDLCKEEIYLSA